MGKFKWTNKKIIIAGIILIIIAFFIGFYMGVDFTIKKVVKAASGFIEINKDLVYRALFQYENNIGNCYPPLNMS